MCSRGRRRRWPASFRSPPKAPPWRCWAGSSSCWVVTLGVFLLSLLGVPPLVGFAAKLQIFSVLFNAGNHYRAMGEPGLGSILYALLAIGGLNTVLSAVYYLKVLKVMILETPL